LRTPVKPRLGTRRQPEESRAAILRAAIHEFSREGVAGARMEAIAKAARVNKALLYYYYRDKDALYGTVLEHVFTGLTAVIDRALEQDLPLREKFLAYVRAHFDYIASNPLFPRVVQSNLMWTGHRCVEQYQHVAKNYIRPIFTRLGALIRAGTAAGEFRPVDPMQFVPSVIALIVMYFSSAPLMKLVAGFDPLAPERIAQRRAAVLDFVSAALFK
jgi:TetR/AcrR family transcriptional regulator